MNALFGCSIRVLPSITVVSPNGGEAWQKETTQTIKWDDQRPYPPCPGAERGLVCVRAGRTYDIVIPLGPSVCRDNICTTDYRTYTIAKGVSGSSYNWSVGKLADPYDNLAPDGSYTMQVCQSGTSACDSSNKQFTITSTTSGNRPPVIVGTKGPTTLKVGETGTWSVGASDPENGSLSYAVDWGDVAYAYTTNSSGASSAQSFTQNATFTHSYTLAGTYTVTFTVKDNTGLTTQTSITVQIGTVLNQPSITVRYPNGGESLTLGIKDVDFRTEWTSSNLSGNLIAYLMFPEGSVCRIGTAPVSQGHLTATLGTQYACSNIPRSITAGSYRVLLIADTQSAVSDLGVKDTSDGYFTISLVNSSSSVRRDTIAGYYRELLLREPDLGGLDFWDKGGGSLDSVRSGIIASYEYGVKQQIHALYKELLGRSAEAAGLEYWYTKMYIYQWSISQVRDGIKASEEYRNKNQNKPTLTVLPTAQPVSSLLFQNAKRVRFTTIELRASGSAISNFDIVAQKIGNADNKVLSTVYLLDENGNQVSANDTINSSNQVNLNVPISIPAGATKTLTIAADIACNLSAYAGTQIGLSVVFIRTSATVSGNFPIYGAQHTATAAVLSQDSSTQPCGQPSQPTIIFGADASIPSGTIASGAREVPVFSFKVSADNTSAYITDNLSVYSDIYAAGTKVSNLVLKESGTVIARGSGVPTLNANGTTQFFFSNMGNLALSSYPRVLTVYADINAGATGPLRFAVASTGQSSGSRIPNLGGWGGTATIVPTPVVSEPTVSATPSSISSGGSSKLVFTFPSNTLRSTLYLSCPSGVTGGTSNLCNQTIDVTSNRDYTVILNNTSGQSQNVVPNYYVYTSDNPNYGRGVTSQIMVAPGSVSAGICRLDHLDGANITQDSFNSETECLVRLCEVYGPANARVAFSSRCTFNGRALKTYSVLTSPSVTVVSPNGGESWRFGETRRIEFRTQGTRKLTFNLVQQSPNVTTTLVNGDLNVGRGYIDVVPAQLPGFVSGSAYKVQIFDPENSAVSDWSDGGFTITSPTPHVPSITVISPNGGGSLTPGTVQTIQWTRSGTFPSGSVQKVRLLSTGVNTQIVYPLYTFPADSTQTSYNWSVGSASDGTLIPAGSNYTIQVLVADKTSTGATTVALDESNSSFTITASQPPAPTLSLVLNSTVEDRAGAWGNFKAGVGNGNKSADDWNWTATLTAPEGKVIKSIKVAHNNGEGWSTDNPADYPLVVVENGAQLNYGLGQVIIAGGSQTYRLFGQKESITSYGFKTTITFTDGTSVSATAQ